MVDEKLIPDKPEETNQITGQKTPATPNIGCGCFVVALTVLSLLLTLLTPIGMYMLAVFIGVIAPHLMWVLAAGGMFFIAGLIYLAKAEKKSKKP